MPPGREPWIKLKVRTDESDKLASLPSDSARWGWIRVLLKAKTQRRMGVFASRQHLRTVIAPHGRFIGAWLVAGLLHEWPVDCPCVTTYGDVGEGELVVHDYRKEQRDPTNADRQAGHRGRNRNGVGNGKRNGGSNADRNADRNATGTPHSRARGTTETETETERDSKSATDSRVLLSGDADSPRLTAEQFADWKSLSSRNWGPFKAAWLARGFLNPPHGDGDDPKSQRSLVWEIADARPDDLARWVAEAPGRSVREVLEHVLEQWHAARKEGAERADAQEAESAEHKTETRADAKVSMARIGDLLPGRTVTR